MMHYRKGENIEKQLTKEELPFEDFLAKDTEFLWMHVNGGTKVNNVLTFAKKALDKGEHKNILWSGQGGGVIKTISCAEILKRSYPLYQVTRMCYAAVEEHWVPNMEGLDEIVANRQIPALHIFMSLEPIDDNVKGLQKPNTTTDFWVYDNNTSSSSNSTGNHRQGNNNENDQSRQTKFRNQRLPNQHKNYQQQRTNNQYPTNEASSMSGANQQIKFNKPKRKKPNQERDKQNQPRNSDNSN